MSNTIDYSKNGLIMAPAGHGKTEDIVSQVEHNKFNKKVLILTHTNIGVQELENRLKKKKINLKKINVCTIASFALKYIKMFPSLSGFNNDKKLFENDIYEQMSNLLNNIHIREIVRNTYEQLFVDEYQDCSLSQHKMIKGLCNILNYKIYGDPLQSIYEFNDLPVNFDEITTNDFELIGKLDYPWRWNNKNKKLGEWILEVRKEIENNNVIDLYTIQNTVKFIKSADINKSLISLGFQYIHNNIPNVILTKLTYQAKNYVKKFAGKYKMQEEIECNDLKKFTELVNESKKEEVLIELFNILKSSYTGLNKFDNIISKVRIHSYDFSKLKTNKELGNIIIEYLDNEQLDVEKLIRIIKLIENSSGIKLCRYDLISIMKKILNNIKVNPNKNPLDILRDITSNRRQKKFTYLISRVLLVKGMQFENVIIIEPENMTKKEFYVAISRATNSLTIISKNNILKFDN